MKQKQDTEWNIEKFQTGGNPFFKHREAVDFKNKLKAMCPSFDYKVMKKECNIIISH
jgi:hypothetical protein